MLGLREPFSESAYAGVESAGRRGAADAAQAPGYPAGSEAGPRALQRLADYPGVHSGRRRGEMDGRKIVPHLRPGTPDHTYLPGPHRGVWNEESLIESKDLSLCEALIDALTFWCATTGM